MERATGFETTLSVSRLCEKLQYKARIYWSNCMFELRHPKTKKSIVLQKNAKILSSIVINFSGYDRPVWSPLVERHPLIGF